MKRENGNIFTVFYAAIIIAVLFSSPSEAKRNVILIIPDGCSSVMWTAIRAMTVGADGFLNVDRLPVQGRVRTYAADAFVTDSAAAATAFASGVKTNYGVLGMDASTTLGDSLTGKPVPTILELARQAGYATGLISTASIQHATPAAFYSHRAHRDWYNLIANDLVDSRIDVLMGGGKQYMIPRDTMCEEGGVSRREDSRNLIAEMQKKGYTYIYDNAGFRATDPRKTDRLLGLFNPGHMEYELHRSNDKAGEPGIWEMTEKALGILSRNRKGFFLMVEAARIDHAGHDHLTQEFLWDGIACDKAVGVAMEFARKNRNTLVIVVPDHGTGGPHLVGMHNLSRPDSALVDKGFPNYRLDGSGFPVDDGGRPVAIQWVRSTAHTGEDVTVSASGPYANELGGVIQNIDVFRVMARHLGLRRENEKRSRNWQDIIDF